GGRVIFTSGATEAINLAMKGCGLPVSALASEHAAVLDCVEYLRGDTIPVDPDGRIAEMPSKPGLFAAMLVNNEIGTIQPIADIAAAVHSRGGLLLCDAVQGFGRVAMPDGPDLIAISGHKIHGPKGIGALWVRDGIALEPLIHGGGQEQGVRSGTLSPALCAGFGAAAMLASERLEADAEHVCRLWDHAVELFADWTINGSIEQRYKGNLNIRREGLDVGRLMSECRDVLFSAGSACASGSGRPSHVLRAIGLADAQAKSSIRLGFGRYTTLEEIERAAHSINAAAERQLA
ncbi:MAG TPA: aminotransferase class V-fold PLP-dependent enzyme, partial [Sphingorhabdus sp.]|nr:aminotransferase class V-fold PLP-dependent enzyme [Sphingorhabdus sp.]